MNWDRPELRLPADVSRMLKVFAVLGGAALVLGFVQAPDRAWANVLLVSYYLVGLGLAGIFFVALQYVSGAGWSVALRRVPEAMTAALLVGALGLALLFLFDPHIYPWVGAAGAFTGFKRAWLRLPFFAFRAVAYIALWMLFAFAVVRGSRRQDGDGDLAHTRRNIRLSAIFLVVFAITFWLASYDWIMSLEPRWSSTIFGIYNFSGLFASGLAAIIVLAICLERLGPLRGILHEEHLHDLGKLLFAFSTFWMYIWFSQYMLIWYANIPEETVYFVRRLHGYWTPLFILNIFLNWVVPFLVLLPRRTKRTRGMLLRVSVVVLLGHWLDLYLMILPPFMGRRPTLGAWELGGVLLIIGVFGLVFFRAVRGAAIVPVRDPYLIESLQFHD